MNVKSGECSIHPLAVCFSPHSRHSSFSGVPWATPCHRTRAKARRHMLQPRCFALKRCAAALPPVVSYKDDDDAVDQDKQTCQRRDRGKSKQNNTSKENGKEIKSKGQKVRRGKCIYEESLKLGCEVSGGKAAFGGLPAP